MENSSNIQQQEQQNWQMPPASPYPPQTNNSGCMADSLIIGIFALLVGILIIFSGKNDLDQNNTAWEEEQKKEEHYRNDIIDDGIVDSTGTVIYPARTRYEKYCYYDSLRNTLPYINPDDYQASNTDVEEIEDTVMDELEEPVVDELTDSIIDRLYIDLLYDSHLNESSDETDVEQQDTKHNAMPDSIKEILRKQQQYEDSIRHYAPDFERKCGMGPGLAMLSMYIIATPFFFVFAACLISFLVMFFTQKRKWIFNFSENNVYLLPLSGILNRKDYQH